MKRRNVELDVLRAARDYGRIGVFGDGHSKASQWLNSLYPAGSENERLTIAVISLVDSWYLSPVKDLDGNVQQPYARGITPKGDRRLYELEYPVRAWVKGNWFPFLVACITICVGMAGVVAAFMP